jgi:hypothetical protein
VVEGDVVGNFLNPGQRTEGRQVGADHIWVEIVLFVLRLNVRFSRRRQRKLLCCGILHRVVWQKFTDVSEEVTASIITQPWRVNAEMNYAQDTDK